MTATTSRAMVGLAALAALALSISGCDQIDAFNNKNVLISGDWYRYSSGVKTHDRFHFSEGLILRNDQTWGQYRFVGAHTLEVQSEGKIVDFEIEFIESESHGQMMRWYQSTDDVRKLRFEWRR